MPCSTELSIQKTVDKWLTQKLPRLDEYLEHRLREQRINGKPGDSLFATVYLSGYSNFLPSASPACSKMGLSTSLISSLPASISGEYPTRSAAETGLAG